MLTQYCSSCGGATHYSGQKPIACAKCGRLFAAQIADFMAIASSSSSAPIVTAKKEVKVKRANENEIDYRNLRFSVDSILKKRDGGQTRFATPDEDEENDSSEAIAETLDKAVSSYAEIDHEDQSDYTEDGSIEINSEEEGEQIIANIMAQKAAKRRGGKNLATAQISATASAESDNSEPDVSNLLAEVRRNAKTEAPPLLAAQPSEKTLAAMSKDTTVRMRGASASTIKKLSAATPLINTKVVNSNIDTDSNVCSQTENPSPASQSIPVLNEKPLKKSRKSRRSKNK